MEDPKNYGQAAALCEIAGQGDEMKKAAWNLTPGTRDATRRTEIARTAERLTYRLRLIHQWHQGMVNPRTGMLEYLYLPETDTFVRENCPIRDIASIWDIERLERFLNTRELLPVINKSLQHYEKYVIANDLHMILDPERLGEPSSIAHSAFMILALLYAPSERHTRIAALAEGILQQQRPNGSFKIHFNDLPDHGEELYAGEAMLALLESYRELKNTRYLDSAHRGSSYYDMQYFRRGRVTEDSLVFFANWQSQACRLLFECAEDDALKMNVADYVFRMHDRIIAQGFYEGVQQRPGLQVSVEVASAVEGLNEAYFLARRCGDARAERYGQCVCTGLAYLFRLQSTQEGTERERGGFGFSMNERTQRIDIAGHVASAFMKSVENSIECGEIASM
jgi:hypothetical protein